MEAVVAEKLELSSTAIDHQICNAVRCCGNILSIPNAKNINLYVPKTALKMFDTKAGSKQNKKI